MLKKIAIFILLLGALGLVYWKMQVPPSNCYKGLNCRADFEKWGVQIEESSQQKGVYFIKRGQILDPQLPLTDFGITTESGERVYLDNRGLIFAAQEDGKYRLLIPEQKAWDSIAQMKGFK